MMSIVTSRALPGSTGVTLLARIVGNDGELVTQASITSIAYTVWDLTTDESVATSTSLTVATVVFDSLQTDAVWTKDTADEPGPDDRAGYNFKATIPAATITPDGDRFQIDVKFTPASGQPFVLTFQFDTLEVHV